MKKLMASVAFATVLATGSALSLSTTASATTWDVVNDFSITNGNPNGQWTYGYGVAESATFTEDTSSGASYGGFANWNYWAIAPNGLPLVSLNVGGSAFVDSTLVAPRE